MHLCYIDESGTADLPGNTSHFVLAGLSIPIWYWKQCDIEITAIKEKYECAEAEIHTAWIARSYLEQSKIPNFESLSHQQRRSAVASYRKQELLRLQRASPKQYRQTKKNYVKTEPYVHLTHAERKLFLFDLAAMVGNWEFSRLFADCVDKVHFDPSRARYSLDASCFDQIVSRFEKYLQATETNAKNFGLIIHDNNDTVAKRHTELMKDFHKKGTLWTQIKNIIETPLFVDSQLTGMVQIADLCAYALRRYLENSETDLFDQVFKRADRRAKGTGSVTVGVRHFTNMACSCCICVNHRK